MKKIFLYLLSAFALNANAQGEVILEPVDNAKTEAANTFWVYVDLPTYENELRAINVDLSFPEGFTVGTTVQDFGDGCKWDYNFDEQGTATNWAASGSKKTDNGTYYHFTVYANSSDTPFHGSKGRLFSIKVKTPTTAGVYPVKVLSSTYAVKSGIDAENLNWTSDQVSFIVVGTPENVTFNPEGAVSSTVTKSLPAGANVDLSNVTELNGSSDNDVNVTFTHKTENDTQWGTICLPVAITPTDGVEYYEVTNIGSSEVTIKKLDAVAAGQPAIFKKTAEGKELTIKASGKIDATVKKAYLVGVMKAQTVTTPDSYYLKDNKFWSINENFKIGAFKAYLQTKSGDGKAASLDLVEDAATAINALMGEGDVKINGIYDVNGAAQNDLQKGINIVKLSNGKTQKIIVK